MMSKFFPTSAFKWIDPKDLDSNKNSHNISKGYIVEFDFEYPKKLRDKNLKCCMKRIYLLIDDGIYDKKSFLRSEKLF